ncbi:MAG: hypothetical protein [Caudoviricetes sp.]|nr:MAG: hypothetical protein [Caudoviricetes sp.]
MSKITKVFDLKSRIKVSIDVSEKELENTIKELCKALKDDSDKAKQHQARYMLSAAAERGMDGLVEAVFTQAFRESFREGVDFGFGSDEIKVSPPQLFFKR